MVKLDTSRDYYADLDLPTSCTDDDIKKQFRKLALRYHPDRNPGKEVEFQPKFQAIQAAHEILCDPEQRRKYDAGRRRTAFDSSTPGSVPSRRPTGHHYQARSDYPPPPRRAQQQQTQPPPRRPAPANAGRGGAERYSNFPTPPPTAKASGSADPKSRANIFNTWQNMNNAAKAQAQRAQGHAVPPPWTGPRSSARPPAGSSPTDDVDEPLQRSAWEEINTKPRPGPGRTSSTRGAHRPGAFSTQSFAGDEGPAPTSAYTSPRMNRNNLPRRQSEYTSPQVPPRPPPSSAQRAEDLFNNPARSSGDEAPFTEGSRERSPYAAASGEKTYFAPDHLRRSASVRDATRLHQPPPHHASNDRADRHRSLSPKQRTQHQETSNASSSQYDGSNAAHTVPKQQPHPRPFVVYSSDSSDGDTSQPAPRRASYANGMSSSSADSSSQEADSAPRPKAQPTGSWANRKPREPPLPKSKSLEEQMKPASESQASVGPTVPPKSNIFTFPLNNDAFTRNSHPELRTRTFNEADARFLSPEGPPPHFGANASVPRRVSHPAAFPTSGNDVHAPQQPSPNAQQVPQADDATRMPPPPPPPPPQKVPLDSDATSKSDTSFPADTWQRDLKEENWATRWASAPAGSTKSLSPTRSNIKRTRGNVHKGLSRGQANPVTVEDIAETEEQVGSPPMNSASSSRVDDDGDAMDIDEAPPAREPDVVTVEEEGDPAGPRKVYVETSRPDWRATSQNGQRRQSAQETPPQLPPKHSSNITMDDFRHVAPISGSTSGAGVRDLGDLASDLPFESRPASTHPSRPPIATPRGEIPKPPIAPVPPGSLSRASWDTYLSHFTEYISKWNGFNARMVAHFQDRAVEQAEMERGPAGGMLEGWVGTVGETEGLKGWDSYVRCLREEERWRTQWAVACEKHMDAVDRHGRLRAQLLRNVA